MKKVSFIPVIGVLLMLFSCNGSGRMSDMPKFDKKECHYEKGFQDYADFCKYFYNEDSVKQFETHDKFSKVSGSDIPQIQAYFEDFKERIQDTEYYEKFDFDCLSQVKIDDCFYIYTKEGYEKFGYYDVYYVDMSKCMLYFIHSNT